MPTYTYTCQNCGETFQQWRSIHAEKLDTHSSCGGRVSQVIQPPMLYAVGNRGAKTREVDARESRWSKDMPAYQRFRMNGYQPQHIDGCAKLESEAKGRWHIETGQPYDDSKIDESRDLARAIAAGEV